MDSQVRGCHLLPKTHEDFGGNPKENNC